MVTVGSEKPVWWECPNGMFGKRVFLLELVEKSGCPVCAGKVKTLRNIAEGKTEPFAADDKRIKKVHGVMSELLIVLVEDLDRVSFEFTRVNKPGGEFGYGTTREIVDEMAKYLGRDHPTELAASPEGINAILRAGGEDYIKSLLPIFGSDAAPEDSNENS